MKITRDMWYRIKDVQFELIHQLQARECMFIPYEKDKDKGWLPKAPVRWLKAYYIGMLKRHWEQFKFLERDMNLYHSLSRFEDMPTFSYTWRHKALQQKIWMDKYAGYVKKYDFFLETDSPDLKLSITRDGIKIKEFLDKYKLLYYVKYSGSKGVHFLIPYEEFSDIPLKVVDPKGVEFDIIHLFKLLGTRIKTILGCDTVDDSVFDVKRVTKVAYSWDIKSGLIALPLTDEQLYNFNKENVQPENILKEGIYKRRLLWRNEDVPKKQREMNVLKLLSDLDIDWEQYVTE